MIIGIGIDVVETERIGRIYDRFGRRFAARILTQGELLAMPRNSADYLASRFAAKEAAVKALGCGFALGITPQHVEVAKNTVGAPGLVLHGPARSRAELLGVEACHLSISHERHCAVAVAVLEGG